MGKRGGGGGGGGEEGREGLGGKSGEGGGREGKGGWGRRWDAATCWCSFGGPCYARAQFPQIPQTANEHFQFIRASSKEAVLD